MPVSGIFPVPRPIFSGRFPAGYSQASPAATSLAGGGFAVVWTARSDAAGGVVAVDVVGRLLTPDGKPARGFFVGGSADFDRDARAPVVAADGAGGFTVAWPQNGFDGYELWVRQFAQRARPRGPAAPFPTVGAVSRQDPALAVNPAGAYALAWLEDHDFRSDETSVRTQGFVRQGLPLGPEVALDVPATPATAGRPPAPAVGMDGLGRRVAVWIRSGVLWGQRLGQDGSPLGPRFMIGPSGGWGTALAMAANGSWTVAWDGTPAAGATLESHPLQLRRYAPDGSPLGPPVTAGLAAGFAAPVLSADRHRNFVLGWLEGRVLTARLFNRALVPQGAPIQVSRPSSGPSTDTLGAALGEDGRLLLAWAATGPSAFGEPPRARLWQARRDADLCAFRGTFLCDTGNDGGAAEETLAFGLPGDVPLLGDLDGDGRDDPCVYRNGRFLCDTAQDGGAAESRARFSGVAGQAGQPFLGDLDGDGRDDPCVRRGNRFLCDLDRDGVADLDLALGDSRDPGLLGDVDGDGDDDPCFYAGEELRCDTAHDGLPPDWAVSLAGRLPAGFTPGAPLLGDIDGDGRDDLCLASVADTGRLLCWVRLENGSAPEPAVETRFTFSGPGSSLLLGDVDRF